MSAFVKCFISFGLGVAAGSLFMSMKNKKTMQKDLDILAAQIKKDFENERRKEEEFEKKISEEKKQGIKEAVIEARNKPAITDYVNMYEGDTTKMIDIPTTKSVSPRVISEDDLYSGEGAGYIGSTLTLYSDGVLVDSSGNVVKDIKETIGEDFLARFYGTEEETVMYVRNDETRTDYEILKKSDPYAETVEEG